MTFQKFKREDSMVDNKQPYITLRENAIAFNSLFLKDAKLVQYKYASIHVDSDNNKIGFEFHNNSMDKDRYTLYSDSVTNNNRNISAQQFYKKYKWIDKISKLSDNSLKRFKPDYDNIQKMWVIVLIPSFEYTAKVKEIPNSTVGIYRYKYGDEIVYIGKGKIKSRANSPERKKWVFDKIEYSIVKDNKKQSEYESYWLEAYKRETGSLPVYNKISARKNNQ